ncbi:retinitis pigmentosa 1-like 1 protein [Colossoma macropomum]|uniref:retinitis pigmentosa 1-like 1 protein n=1 Tax=Colossoma macropomum TaxID=42526 RepID=UPI001863E2EC|nr:retinitis pigmentosa 1-like 1 protein [Colossoma macropomum]
MQRAGSSNASPKIRNDSQRPVSRFSSVTSATPAKRITFFKSGDTQFSGVRMAIHKRSFKCFDALLDDLSQKVPLPFGVRTITTPRGTHSIQRLEQLEDGGCYLCSDRHYVRPIDVEAAGKRPAVWHHSHPHNSRKKPSRPEEPPTGHSGQHYHRHPKRIVLVKNSDPAVRRSIILSRRTARSLRVFMDEISELMQCHVRKLYTLDGRKIDSIQSLMQCPSVLVCVGRESFKPLLLENLRKHSEEKLPGMGTRSHSSVCSEGHESKKNVNFGLETKKSIIHPRSDSSNRSTRFSLSSEKSYTNGLCMTPGQSGCISTCPYTKDVILNDDIEKRVLVNKDGSLSVEMKVRFRLVNDETLQWSTEIKKSATTSNESSSVKEGEAHYLQGKSENSDPESNSACEAEETCAPKLHQKLVEESHCQNCCNHCQEYDIWKNPMHKDSRDNGGRKSSSSSASSHTIMHKKASVDSVRTISRSSEEYTEHVVEKASCFQQTVEEGDTRVEYCSISRCCSRSEISGTASKLKSRRPNEDTHETSIVNVCHHNGDKKINAAFENTFSDLGAFEVPKATEDRPISAVSNSSKVLESLKEDQDDDYDDLPPSASRASEWSQSDNIDHEHHFTCVHCYGGEASPNFHLSPRPPSKVSGCSAHSSKHKKYRSMYRTPDSATSSVSPRPPCQCGVATPGSIASDMQSGLDERIPITSKSSTVSNKSKARTNSPSAAVLDIQGAQVCGEGTESEDGSRSAMSANASVSGKSRNSTVCPYCSGCEKSITPVSRLSENTQDIKAQDADKDAEVKSFRGRSSKSHRSERSNKCTQGASPVSNVTENGEPVPYNLVEAEDIQGRSESVLSGLSHPSATSKKSNKSNRTACGRSSVVESMVSEPAKVEDVEERTKSAMSVKSNASAKSNTNSVIPEVSTTLGQDDQKAEEISQDDRAVSPLSHKSNRSSKSRSSNRSHCSKTMIIPECNNNYLRKTPQVKESERGDSPISTESASHGQEPEIIQEPRVDNAMSMTSNSSSKRPSSVLGTSGMSAKSQDETVEKGASPVPTTPETKLDEDPGISTQERAASAMSNTSKTSKKSNASSRNLGLVQENEKCTKLNEAENAAVQASDMESVERVPSTTSAKTHSSTGSRRSHKSDNNIQDTETTSQPRATSPVTENANEGIDSERPSSAISKSSKVSVKSDACSERISKSALKPTGQAKEDIKGCAQNTLTVSSPSPKKNKRVPVLGMPKSPVPTGSNERAPSGISVNSRASSKSTSSKTCHCSSNSNGREANSKKPPVNDECVQRVGSILSGKSKSAKSPTPSPYGQSDEPLSPTSTASVSLGLCEEEKSDDLNERSMSSMSQTLQEGEGPLERSTPELAVSGNAADSSETKERVKTAVTMSSAVSKNSQRSSISQELHKSPERAISPASVGKPESVKSTKSKAESKAGSQLDDGNRRVPSALSSCRNTHCKASQPQAVSENNNIDESQIDKASATSGRSSKCSKNKTASGKAVPYETTKSKDQGPEKIKKTSSSNLKIKGSKIISDCNSEASSVKSLKNSKSDNSLDDKEKQTLSTSVMSDIPQNCRDPSDEMPNKNVMPVIHLDSSSDSVLSHTLSAADLLREKVGNARPVSRGSNTSGKNCDLEELMNTGSKCEKRSTSKQRKLSTSSHNKSKDQGIELMPSSLPNASPAEVINDWLKNIPIDGPMYEMEDEFNEEHNEAVPQIVTVNEEDEESSQKEIGEISENVMEMNDSQEIEWAEGGGPIKGDNSVICNETRACSETSETNAANTDPCPPPKFTKKECLPKRCHSSVQVMKVLLRPKLDRCNSLPEVSPVYGRRLSTSAKGLLDCLANLQLIDSDPKNGKEDKYNEIISILQSLWISEPSESEQDKHNIKDQCSAEDEFNPRSSSGVDVSSGSIGSINGGVEKPETAGRTAPVIEQEALQVQVDTVKEGECDPSSATPESTDTSHVSSDPLTPDIAERVRCSPEDEKPEEELPIDEDSHAREEVTQSNENQKETTEAEFSNKSSENDSNGLKAPADKETDSPENANSGMSTSAQRGILTRRVSQDPDPVWVLSLLKKLEKQFMSHYANAVAEFKVKWDLDDSEMLDKMISELKEEVQKRIQSSINRELQKIQSRAGRPPRPPISALSRDSTVQTEQRRRRLKVMRDKSINPSLSQSEDMNTASGTEFSDQRSEDEYCPCDTCLKKKMASRAVQRAEALSLAPVLKDFDLKKILQRKKDPPATMATESPQEGQKNLKEATNCSNVQNNLDVVHEESEVHHDVKGQTDEDIVEVEGTADATQNSKDENSEEDATLASKNQDVDAGLVNDGGLGVEEGLYDDGNKAEEENSAEDGKIEKGEDRAEEGETEIERVEEQNVQEEKETDDKGEEEENKEASVSVDGDAEDADNREAAKEEDQPEKEAAEMEEMGNSEHGDEGKTAIEGETGEEAKTAEEEEVEDIEEKIETAEEGEVTEDETGEETESPHESGELENVEEAENKTAETTEGDAKDEGDTTNMDEGGGPDEDDGEGNYGASSQAEAEAKDEADEDQAETNPDQAKTEQEEQQVPSLTASEEVDVQAEGEDCGSDEKHQNDTEAKSTDEAENEDSEKGAENKNESSTEGLTEQFNSDGTEADASGQACGEDSGHRLIKQITKTSVESQPGSMENATDQKVRAKLKDICSFMESSESQEDSIVVITKQSPFTERRNVSSRTGNKEEVGNEVIEWQVSPKRRNRSPARANKQRRPKDSDVKVDDLEF